MDRTRLPNLCCACVLGLLPFAAHGSFNSGLCGKGEFGCHFAFIGLLLGFFGGLPISAAIFVIIHLVFRNPERDKVKQIFLGGLLGLAAFEVAAIVGAAWAAWVQPSRTYPMEVFVVAWVLMAIGSALYARSDPPS